MSESVLGNVYYRIWKKIDGRFLLTRVFSAISCDVPFTFTVDPV